MSSNKIMEFIAEGARMGASDIHMMVGLPPTFRIQGTLVTRPGDAVIEQQDMKMLTRRVMPTADIARKQEQGDQADFTISLPDKSRARLNIYTGCGIWAAAVRILPQRIPDLDELGLPPVVMKMISRESGLLLISGTSGSGKTTSLASLLHYINQNRRCHIITLEDPVEYLHHNIKAVINQREIGIDSPSFASGLRSALRQDPDIILVGEMRDVEDISIALSAAETGHLVLASVHSGSAIQTVERIIDVFPSHQQQARTQVANALIGIIHQKLFPSSTGDSRVLAAEVLVMTPAVRNLVRTDKMHMVHSSLQTGTVQGMVSMKRAVQKLLEQKKISDQTAGQVAEQWGGYGYGGQEY